MLHAGGGERVVGRAEGVEGLVGLLRGGAEGFGERAVDGCALDGRVGLRVLVGGVVGREERAELGGTGGCGQMQEATGWPWLIDDGEAALEGELVAQEDAVDGGEVRVRGGEVEAGEG